MHRNETLTLFTVFWNPLKKKKKAIVRKALELKGTLTNYLFHCLRLEGRTKTRAIFPSKLSQVLFREECKKLFLLKRKKSK